MARLSVAQQNACSQLEARPIASRRNLPASCAQLGIVTTSGACQSKYKRFQMLPFCLGLVACSFPKPKLLEDAIDSGRDAVTDVSSNAPLDAASGLTVTAISQPPRVAITDSINVTIAIHAIAGSVVAWKVFATNGHFAPSNSSAELDADGNGQFMLSYTASTTAADDLCMISLDDRISTAQKSFAIKVRELMPVGQASSFADHAGVTLLADVLGAQQLVLGSQAYLMRLGLFVDNAGYVGRLALYLDHGMNPATLVAKTAIQPIVIGRNELRLTDPVLLNAGIYWIAGNFGSGAQVRRNSTNVVSIFLSLSPSSPFPNTTAGASSNASMTFNYYAEVIP